MGGFLDGLKKIFTMPDDSGSKFITFNIICNKCGEEITVRASKTSDISRVYEGEGPSGAEYFLRKELPAFYELIKKVQPVRLNIPDISVSARRVG